MMEQVTGVHMVGHVVPMQNRLLTCPDCGGRLSSDKNAFTTRDGNIFRERACTYCHSVFYTKQEPERVTRQMKEDLGKNAVSSQSGQCEQSASCLEPMLVRSDLKGLTLADVVSCALHGCSRP